MVALSFSAFGEPEYPGFREPPHDYQKRIPTDVFTRIKDDLQTGKIKLDQSSEKACVESLLRSLEISPSSQLLVFSTTSLQLSRISPANPRAIYFNEDLYIGWVPGGRIEVIGIDPEWGSITYIFDVPQGGKPPLIQRSTRCMNCHASVEIGDAPGLLISSVVPGPGGGSLEGFRQEETGHGIAWADRFGGWHLTGKHDIKKHWGNLTGELSKAGLKKIPNQPGQHFRLQRYPVPSSDALAHLLLEHQVGFVNRFISATYRARAVLAGAVEEINESEVDAFLEKEASVLTRYLLFADEVKFPTGGIAGEVSLKNHFQARARRASDGLSLRDFDLKTRMFRYRCSYMIHSASFQGLPTQLMSRVFTRMNAALSLEEPLPEYAYLPVSEKRIIRRILRDTLPLLPKDW
ncbi:MAG: hypothetical protein VB980_03815 [Opitutales bacterium]